MYEEPYRWVEAVGNRRPYLDEQFKQGSPVVALSYDAGILLATVSKGTPKLYEIYDRIALGGMGHPADLEKLTVQFTRNGSHRRLQPIAVRCHRVSDW